MVARVVARIRLPVVGRTWSIGWWRVVVAAPTSAAATSAAAARTSPSIRVPGIPATNDAGFEDHPNYDAKEDDPEKNGDALADLIVFAGSTPTSLPVSISVQPLGGKHQAVLDTAASLEDVRIVGRVIAFAYDVGRAELEFFGEGGLTGPLDVVVVVVGACVLAAHHIDFVQALCVAADAFELRAGLAGRMGLTEGARIPAG